MTRKQVYLFLSLLFTGASIPQFILGLATWRTKRMAAACVLIIIARAFAYAWREQS